MASDAYLAELKEAAERLFQLIDKSRQLRLTGETAAARQCDREIGRLLLEGVLAQWMLRFFRRKKVPADLVEDLAQSVRLKLIRARYRVQENAFGLLHRAAYSQFVDYWRKIESGVDKYLVDRPDDFDGDDDTWLQSVQQQQPTPDPYLLVAVRRSLQTLEKINPKRAAILEMVAEGLSAKEIAAVLYDKDKDAVTEAEEHNIRDRVYQARKQAKPLFGDCHD